MISTRPQVPEILGLPDQGLAVFLFSEFREVIPSVLTTQVDI